MSRKTKGDSILAGLDAGKRHQVDKWLFEENCTYRKVVENCKQEFQMDISIASVSRYFQKEYGERVTDRYARRAVEEEETLKALGTSRDSKRSYRLLLRMAELEAARETMKPDGDFRKVACLLRVIVMAREEANEARRIGLMREKFEFSASAAALAIVPKVQGMTTEDAVQEEARILAIKRYLFGKDLPEDTSEEGDTK